MAEKQQRQKLELETNIPKIVQFVFDPTKPLTGKNDYGEWWLYALKDGDEEKSLFITDPEQAATLAKYKKGDSVRLLLEEIQHPGRKPVKVLQIEPPVTGGELKVPPEEPKKQEEYEAELEARLDRGVTWAMRRTISMVTGWNTEAKMNPLMAGLPELTAEDARSILNTLIISRTKLDLVR